MSQVPMVIMVQSLHGFEVGPVLQTSLQVGVAMLRGRSAGGHGGRHRAYTLLTLK